MNVITGANPGRQGTVKHMTGQELCRQKHNEINRPAANSGEVFVESPSGIPEKPAGFSGWERAGYNTRNRIKRHVRQGIEQILDTISREEHKKDRCRELESGVENERIPAAGSGDLSQRDYPGGKDMPPALNEPCSAAGRKGAIPGYFTGARGGSPELNIDGHRKLAGFQESIFAIHETLKSIREAFENIEKNEKEILGDLKGLKADRKDLRKSLYHVEEELRGLAGSLEHSPISAGQEPIYYRLDVG